MVTSLRAGSFFWRAYWRMVLIFNLINYVKDAITQEVTDYPLRSLVFLVCGLMITWNELSRVDNDKA